MAISNCLFSSTSENPRGFLVWCVLAKLSAITHTTTHSRDRGTLNEKKKIAAYTNYWYI